MARAHFSTADLERAHKAASKFGYVKAWEISPADGKIRVEFGENKPDNDDDWRDDCPAYRRQP